MNFVWCVRPKAGPGLLSFLAALTIVDSVHAEPPARLELTASSECPAAPLVAAQLKRVLPDTLVSEQITDGSSTVRAEVSDAGSRFVVSVAGQRRRFEDRARDCAERARLAAVFIGIVLDPPQTVGWDPEPARPEAQAAKPDGPPSESGSAPHEPASAPHLLSLELEIGAMATLAPTADALRTPVAAGAAGRFLLGRSVRLSVGVHALLPSTLRFESADARVTWLGGDIGVRFVHRARDFELAGELGPSLAYLFATGERVDRATTEGRLEVGARASVIGRLWASQSLGIFAALSSTMVPQPSSLEISPDGKFGETPALWFGTTIGLMTTL